jgi:RNA polymerase sigma factor (sigma-70 family)
MRNEADPNGRDDRRNESPIDGEMIRWARAVAVRAIAPFDRRPGCAGDADDVAQEILVAMISAAKRYDPTRGPFVRYFAPHMKQFARRAARRAGQESGSYGRPMRAPEGRTVSIDAELRPNSWQTDGESFPMSTAIEGRDPDPADDADRLDKLRAISAALRRLDNRSRLVLELRLSGRILSEIGDDLGLSRERIRQIEREAIDAIARDLGRPDERRPTLSGKNIAPTRPRTGGGRRGRG